MLSIFVVENRENLDGAGDYIAKLGGGGGPRMEGLLGGANPLWVRYFSCLHSGRHDSGVGERSQSYKS